MSKKDTFFVITSPDSDSLKWAKEYWDTYGFDYDITRSKGGTILAWPYDCTTEELKRVLDEDGIEYTTFEDDAETLFA